jgi:hypothetical protein
VQRMTERYLETYQRQLERQSRPRLVASSVRGSARALRA